MKNSSQEENKKQPRARHQIQGNYGLPMTNVTGPLIMGGCGAIFQAKFTF
jgi:hypothetical protein